MAFIEPMHRNKPNVTYLLSPWIVHEAEIWVAFHELKDGGNEIIDCDVSLFVNEY